jgi:orotate phosphoribosyltransferase
MEVRVMEVSDQSRIFDIWLSRHKGLVFKVVYAYAFTSHDREDLFQEIATQIWNSIARFREESRETTWLYRVALNTALAWSRKERRFQHTDVAAQVCGMLAARLRDIDCDSVISPALGGIIVGQEVDRALGKRHIFVEKEAGGLAVWRGFQIRPGEKLIVAEDVVTRGGRVQQTIDIVHDRGGSVEAVGVIVDRSGKNKPDFGRPFVSLIRLDMETFEPENLPEDLTSMPAVKPGSV